MNAITSVIIDYVLNEDVEKLKLMNMFYFDQNFTMERVAQELFKSRRGAYYMADDIVNQVAEKMGYF